MLFGGSYILGFSVSSLALKKPQHQFYAKNTRLKEYEVTVKVIGFQAAMDCILWSWGRGERSARRNREIEWGGISNHRG